MLKPDASLPMVVNDAWRSIVKANDDIRVLRSRLPEYSRDRQEAARIEALLIDASILVARIAASQCLEPDGSPRG